MKRLLSALTLLALSGTAFTKYGIDEMMSERGTSSASGSGWLLVCLALIAFTVIDAGTSRRRIKALEAQHADADKELNDLRATLGREVAERNLHYLRYRDLQDIVQRYCEGLTSDAEFIEATGPHLSPTEYKVAGKAG